MTSSSPASSSRPEPAGVAGQPVSHFKSGPPERRVSKPAWKWFVMIFVLAAAVGCLLLELYLQFGNTKNTMDFLAFYASGAILRHGAGGRLYDVALQIGLEHKFFPQRFLLPFYHPPFEAWLFAGLTYFPVRQAYLIWTVVNLIVLGLVFYMLRYTGYQLDQDRRLVWLAASAYIVAGVLVKGQDALLLAAVFVLAFLALKKKQDVAAGLILGVGLFRFEIVLPFVFIFLLRRRWKLLAGFSVMGLTALVVSLLTVGSRGLLQYAKVLVEAGEARGSVIVSRGDLAAMPSLRGAFATLLGGIIPRGVLFPVVLACTLLLLGWAAWTFKNISKPESRAFDVEFSLAVIVAVIASYHLFLYMMTPLILAAYLMLGHEAAARREGALKDRAATILWLLFAFVPVVGFAAHFYHFTVLFMIVIGLAVWCAQESRALMAGQA